LSTFCLNRHLTFMIDIFELLMKKLCKKFIHSFIYSPNAIKTKHNKITQLGMTTRHRICTYRSHKIIIK